MSDLSDDDLRYVESRPDWEPELVVPLVAEIRRHRSSVASDEVRFREVLSRVGVKAIDEFIDPPVRVLCATLLGIIATRSARELASSGAARIVDSSTVTASAVSVVASDVAAVDLFQVSRADLVAVGVLAERLVAELTDDELDLLVRISSPAVDSGAGAVDVVSDPAGAPA